MALQLNRFNNIYPTRESAFSLLNNLSRSYSECVTVRYYEDPETEKIGIIVVIYKSETKGDYEVIYESAEKIIETSFRIFRVTRQYEGQSDLECINVALFGETPVNRDMVIITSTTGNTTVTLIYYEKEWIRIGSDGSEIKVINSDTVNLEMIVDPENNLDKTIKADVKIDGESIIYDNSIDKIRVNKIYGGTF